MKFTDGTHVEWDGSTHSDKIHHGILLGYIGEDEGMAICTDITSGRNPRPVASKRLRLSNQYIAMDGWAA